MLSQAFDKTFFDPGHPWRWLERLFHGFSKQQTIQLNGQALNVSWTARAQRELEKRQMPLNVEMQLLFSCVVKKRLLFDRTNGDSMVPVNEHLSVGLSAVASKACSPEEFARDYPEGRDLSETYAGRLSPGRLEIDFRQGEWQGQFYIG